MLPVIVVVAVALLVAYVMFMQAADVSGAEARKLVQDGARLVDVRTPAEFAAGHIAGALNLPLQQLDRRLAELEPKAAPVVLYCRSGQRSANAARRLKSVGFGAVHNLGAMTRW